MMKKIAFSIVFVLFVYSALAILGALFAQNEVKNIDTSALTQDTNNFEEFFKKTDRIRRNIFLARPFLNLNQSWSNKINTLDKIVQNKPLAQEILGIKDEKTFLVVMQNNTELRPTGGIWGSYGILKISNGKITSFTTDDTYYLDQLNTGKFDPPADVKDIIENEWRFWNANWSPDFKKSVEQGLFFYKQINPDVAFNGVLGPDVDYLLSLIKISGPVELADHSFKLDQDNFIEKMIYEPTTSAVFENRKKYDNPENIIKPQEKNLVLSTIGKEIIDQITTQKKEKQLVQATYDALKNKNLMIYLQKPEVQKKVEKLGWAGRMPEKGNFAMIVDANFGSKLDLLINKQATIKKIAPNRYKATLRYGNEYNLQDNTQFFTNYRNFVRIFVPDGSTQIEQSGGEKVSSMQEDGSTNTNYMSSLIVLKPGEESSLSFTWEVPEDIAKDNLNIITQPGSHLKIS